MTQDNKYNKQRGGITSTSSLKYEIEANKFEDPREEISAARDDRMNKLLTGDTFWNISVMDDSYILHDRWLLQVNEAFLLPWQF